jgi:hypothetical protein
MTKILNEGLDYRDLEGQMDPLVSVDEYKAKMGKDSDIVTLAFTTKSEAAGDDLVNWFERGYEYVLDASVSEGPLDNGKYLVFVELKRRNAVPERIIELIEDMVTLNDLPLKDWTVVVDKEDYEADEEILKQVITTSPHAYREKFEKEDEDINEMRQRAGLDTKKNLPEQDAEIKSFKSMAGL